MPDLEPIFVIPTNRLRDVGETVEIYDEHFRRNGHAVTMIVFDDSSVVNQQKYYSALEKTPHPQPALLRRASRERAVPRLSFRALRDRKLNLLVRNLFRPSYGGNRNYTLMYTLGHLMVSSDDDMRPYALVEDSPESLGPDEISRGKLLKAVGQGVHPQVVRHSGRLSRCSGQARRRSPGQLRSRRADRRLVDGPGNQRLARTGSR